MPGLRGYRPVGGSSRRYSTPSGGTISRRQYDNLRAQNAGFRNMYELERFRGTRTARKWGLDIIEAGKRPTFRDWGDMRELKARRDALREQYPDLTRSQRDQRDSELIAPDGPLARLLQRTGRRPLSNRPVS